MPASQHARVLIVDDKRDNRTVLELMLQEEGYTLLSAESGEQALAMVASDPPDLVLLDVMMPGIDGFEVAASLARGSGTRKIPVIIVTALSADEAQIKGLEAGAGNVLSKPVEREELCARVRNLLSLNQT
jgi:DNA-binding response OmpR family regulator